MGALSSISIDDGFIEAPGCIDVIMMTSRSLPCGIKCTVALVQVHLSDAYGRLLPTGAMCDGWIRLEDSDDQKCGPNISMAIQS